MQNSVSAPPEVCPPADWPHPEVAGVVRHEPATSNASNYNMKVFASKTLLIQGIRMLEKFYKSWKRFS
jgi:hypothetical protein